MKLSFKIDEIKFARALSKSGDTVIKELRVAMATAVEIVQADARAKENHRYKTKSGDLTRSIVTKVAHDGLSGDVHFDEGIASYGKYQHDGTKRGIPADHFIYNALGRKEKEIEKIIENGISTAFKKAGLT